VLRYTISIDFAKPSHVFSRDSRTPHVMPRDFYTAQSCEGVKLEPSRRAKITRQLSLASLRGR